MGKRSSGQEGGKEKREGENKGRLGSREGKGVERRVGGRKEEGQDE